VFLSPEYGWPSAAVLVVAAAVVAQKNKALMRLLGYIGLCFSAACAVAAPSEPGLALQLEAGGQSDVRIDRLVALHVPAGEVVSPFLPVGPFKAKWTGVLVSDLRADVRFSAVLTGTAKCTINGQTVLEGSKGSAVTLNKGENAIVVEYTPPATGDATFRLQWSARAFPVEPVPPTVLRHNPELTAASMAKREGRRLFAQLRCAQCHIDAARVPMAGQGMPELAQDAPILANLGERYTQAFLLAWIQDPHAYRPDSLMPKVFSGDLAKPDPRAIDLAAYLSSQGTPVGGKVDAAQSTTGGALFANLGCIACHTTPGTAVADAGNRVPLAHVAAKWQPAALVEYLQDPAKLYRATRMPNFHLSTEEATQLSAYLLTEAKGTLPPAPKGDVEKGATQLVAAGCLNCHAGAAIPGRPSLADTLKSGWTKGCVADAGVARGQAPDFALSPSQISALRSFGQTDFASLKVDVPAEFAARQITQLRCAACHEHDGKPSVWSTLDADCKALRAAAPKKEAKEGDPLPGGALPSLTWLGEKLRPEWSASFIAGQSKTKPRYWLIARMPAYAFYAPGLSTGLSHQHGLSCTLAKEEPVDPKLAQIGDKLLGATGGFNCIQCHPMGTRPATAPFEAPSTNLASATERLRPSFYKRWMIAPTRVTPDTKMPKFVDEDGQTQITETLDGQAADQFEAIWQHLRNQAPR